MLTERCDAGLVASPALAVIMWAKTFFLFETLKAPALVWTMLTRQHCRLSICENWLSWTNTNTKDPNNHYNTETGTLSNVDKYITPVKLKEPALTGGVAFHVPLRLAEALATDALT